mmetsp:Transcript_32867/g.50871  ORF Transcript_32867/g.50871 Transcript_32867/m.50871 type:complete len:152 (-) Transcript_32867:151-606(-)
MFPPRGAFPRRWASSGPKVSRVRGRRRSRLSAAGAEKIPSLKEFMRKKEILCQYRGLLRCASSMDNSSDAVEEIRFRFRAVRDETPGGLTATMALKEGERQLAALSSMRGGGAAVVDPAPSTKNVAAGGADAAGGDDDCDVGVGVGWPWDR